MAVQHVRRSAQRWWIIPKWKNGWKRRWRVICLAGQAESRSNVHLLWQMETTGSTHSGTGPSAEFRGKFKVEKSLKGCAHCLCLCASTLPLVFKAWIKLFSPLHNTSVFFELKIGIDWSNLCASVNFVLSGSGKLKEIDRLQRHNCAWSDSWNWLFFFLSAASRTHTKVKRLVWKRARFDGALESPSEETIMGAWFSLVCTKKWFTAT